MTTDELTLAQEIMAAWTTGRRLPAPPSARPGGFDLAAAYAVEAELVALRRAAGRITVGRKVGYANKAAWRLLKLDTLVWAHLYDDTVHDAPGGEASLALTGLRAPKIEPEIVFRLKRPVGDAADAAAVLDAVEWIALGFEIIDSPFPDWTFQPADFVAAFGLHAALVVGSPQPVDAAMIPALVDQLARFTVKLSRHGQLVEQGSGRNSLRSPALCLQELAAAAARPPVAEPLAAGELVSSGTLTEGRLIAPGETWSAQVEGLPLQGLTLRLDGVRA